MDKIARAYVRLTDVESSIMKLLCQGVGPKEVGTRAKLGKLDRKTVHYFMRRIKDKLGARTTYQACAIYAQLHPELETDIHPDVKGTEYMTQIKQRGSNKRQKSLNL